MKILLKGHGGSFFPALDTNYTQSFPSVTSETVGGLVISPDSAFTVSFIALVPMLAGGIWGKPRHFWLSCIATGSLYILSLFYFYTLLSYWIEQGYIHTFFRELIFLIPPGLVAIVEGIWLKRKNVTAADRQILRNCLSLSKG